LAADLAAHVEGLGVMGAWDDHHLALTEPLCYGAPETYRLAAEWMNGCARVEDWGCGGGGLRNHIDGAVVYVGVDGSGTPFADVAADLTQYRSESDGIVLRHVLEHNYQWRLILANAIASFTGRLCVVLFTPIVGDTHVLHVEPDYGDVPVIAFSLADLLELFTAGGVRRFWPETHWFRHAHFGTETMIYAER
jgi:hypothetical protein